MKMFLRIISILLLALSVLFIPSCSEDEAPVSVSPVNPPGNSYYGAFVLCQGAEVYPQERYLGFYDINSGEYHFNIYRQGILPLYPRSMVYSSGNIYISCSYAYSSPSKLLKINAWGENQGKTSAELDKLYNPNLLMKFGDKIAMTYMYPVENYLGTFETFSQNLPGDVSHYSNIKDYITSMYSMDGKVYLTSSYYSDNLRDSSLLCIVPPDTSVRRLKLSGKPAGIVRLADNRLLIGCGGYRSIFYFVDPVTFLKTDSVLCPGGISRSIVSDLSSTYTYFISEDDRIVKFNHSQKTFSTFLNNNFAGENYMFSGVNIDPYSGKFYVLYSSRGEYHGGKMQIYSSSGFFERTLAVGKKPVQVLFSKSE